MLSQALRSIFAAAFMLADFFHGQAVAHEFPVSVYANKYSNSDCGHTDYIHWEYGSSNSAKSSLYFGNEGRSKESYLMWSEIVEIDRWQVRNSVGGTDSGQVFQIIEIPESVDSPSAPPVPVNPGCGENDYCPPGVGPVAPAPVNPGCGENDYCPPGVGPVAPAPVNPDCGENAYCAPGVGPVAPAPVNPDCGESAYCAPGVGPVAPAPIMILGTRK